MVVGILGIVFPLVGFRSGRFRKEEKMDAYGVDMVSLLSIVCLEFVWSCISSQEEIEDSSETTLVCGLPAKELEHPKICALCVG